MIKNAQKKYVIYKWQTKKHSRSREMGKKSITTKTTNNNNNLSYSYVHMIEQRKKERKKDKKHCS